MNRRNRRGNDFTESLQSFLQNDTLSLNHALIESLSEGSSQMSIEDNKENFGDSKGVNMNSIILAGNSAEKPSRSNARLNESDKWTAINSFALSADSTEKADLNRCIIIHDEGDNNTIGTHDLNSAFATNCSLKDDDENMKPHDRATSSVRGNKPVIKSIDNINIPVRIVNSDVSSVSDTSSSNRSNDRDTNYNIKSSFNNTECDNSETAANETPKKSNDLLNTLSSLNRKLRRSGGENSSEKLMRRLSEAYAHSPKQFTERLLTIIEESVIHNETDACGLTRRFSKMCKLLDHDYIEDESVIDFAPSLMSPTITVTPATPCAQQKKETKKEGSYTPLKEKDTSDSNVRCETTPTRHKRNKKVYRRTPKTFFRTNTKCVNDTLLNEDDDTFLLLEDKCNRLYSDGSEKTMQRSSSTPSIEEMENIRKLSEIQMALLEDSPQNEKRHAACRSISTPNLITMDNKAAKNGRQYSEGRLFKLREGNSRQTTPKSSAMFRTTSDTSYLSLTSLEKKLRDPLGRLDSNSGSREFGKFRTSRDKVSLVTKKIPTPFNRNSKKKSNFDEKYYTSVHPNDLEQTLLQEIAEKRQRCLNTAKAIMEIDADPKVLEVKKSLEKYPELVSPAELDSLDENSLKFLTTLMSCDAYHAYLQKSKPLVALQEKSKIKPVNGTPRNLQESRRVVRSPHYHHTVERENRENTPMSTSTKRKFFVTPGKSPTSKTRRPKPKQYFSNVNTPMGKESSHGIMKSPHVEGLYRKDYNTVMSPVGMYIRGTDVNLIQTVRSKTNEMLLTPRKAGQSNRTPVKHDAANKNSLKVRLTPRDTPSPIAHRVMGIGERQINTFSGNGDENIPDKFDFPKVVYKSPLKVHTVKNTITGSEKKRMRALLQDTENKIVIRHEGKVKTAEVDAHDNVPEVLYGPLNESIHVHQTAKKTCFMGKRNL